MRGALAAAIMVASASSAVAADPAYCLLYSREYVRLYLSQAPEAVRKTYTKDKIAHILDRNEAVCLNMDALPALPKIVYASRAYYLEQMTVLAKDGPGAPMNPGPEQGTVPATDEVTPQEPPADAVPDGAAKEQADSAPGPPGKAPAMCGRRRPSGFDYGTAEQQDYCRRSYRSYDPATGTIRCRGGKTMRCS